MRTLTNLKASLAAATFSLALTCVVFATAILPASPNGVLV